MVTALGAAAGVAVENARLYDEARRQQRWQLASAEIATQLLSGASSGTALAALTRQALELADADLATVALPDEQRRRLTIEYAEGDGAAEARGLVLPVTGSLSGLVLSTGETAGHRPFLRGPARLHCRPPGRGASRARDRLPARRARRRARRADRRPAGAARCRSRRGATDLVASFAAQAGVAIELAENRRAAAERLSVLRGPGPDRPGPARPGHPAAVRHRHVARGRHADGDQARGGGPGHERGGRDGRDDQGDPRRRSSRFSRAARAPGRGCGRRSSTLAEDDGGGARVRARAPPRQRPRSHGRPARSPSRRWPCCARRCPTSARHARATPGST